MSFANGPFLCCLLKRFFSEATCGNSSNFYKCRGYLHILEILIRHCNYCVLDTFLSVNNSMLSVQRIHIMPLEMLGKMYNNLDFSS